MKENQILVAIKEPGKAPVVAKFIEVTNIAGKKRLINLAWVEDIWDEENGVCIYFAYSAPHAVEQHYIRVLESYEEIKRKVGAENGK